MTLHSTGEYTRDEAPGWPTCHEVLARLYDYLDDELPADRAARAAGHFDLCPPCASRLRFERAFLDRLRRRGPLPHPDPGLAPRIRALLRAHPARGQSTIRGPAW